MKKTLKDFQTNYILKDIKYEWIKKVTMHNFKFQLGKRKGDLILSEFQPLYDYWNFCNKSHNKFHRYTISEWVMYLVVCQLFPNEVKQHTYSKPYKELLQLPRLGGYYEKDVQTFDFVLENHFRKKDGAVRNSILLYYVHFNF